ncbi:UDP-glycosyltransferase 86A1-like [Morus notabilis]|nr:UDP-glycosyltransferase 86A1-like [Morus notabilis]
MEDNHPRPHAIMFSLDYQGHVTPSIHLAMKLASKGFTITFVNTQIVHHQLTKSQPDCTNTDDYDIFAGARELGLDIRYKTMSDGLSLDFNKILNHDEFLKSNLYVLPSLADELIGNLVKEDPSISCLIADTFQPWALRLAKKYNLISVSFWTQPAIVFTLDYHLDLLKINGHYLSLNGNREDTIDYIPGVKSIEPKDLMPYLRETKGSTVTHGHLLLYKSFEDVKNVDFILCNTLEELEYDAIWAIRQKQPMYAIGPIISPFGFTKSPVSTSLRTEFDCSQWLSSKPHGSVLYVSLGSLYPSNKDDLEEIAHGLVLSKANFILVLRPDAVGCEESYALPIGFEDQIKDKGLIVPWCRQVEVISHQAVGGFLTHCGWNSVLDSMWCGVPMLCFPLLIDQVTNRKLVVDDWRIGVNLCDGKSLTRVEVAEKINRLMSGKSGEELKREVMKVRNMLKNASTKDGSSETNLCQFITNVKAKICERTR